MAHIWQDLSGKTCLARLVWQASSGKLANRPRMTASRAVASHRWPRAVASAGHGVRRLTADLEGRGTSSRPCWRRILIDGDLTMLAATIAFFSRPRPHPRRPRRSRRCWHAAQQYHRRTARTRNRFASSESFCATRFAIVQTKDMKQNSRRRDLFCIKLGKGTFARLHCGRVLNFFRNAGLAARGCRHHCWARRSERRCD
jgi:hypothetical protein